MMNITAGMWRSFFASSTSKRPSLGGNMRGWKFTEKRCGQDLACACKRIDDKSKKKRNVVITRLVYEGKQRHVEFCASVSP